MGFRKPSNCKCGSFRDVGHRWVVLKRRDKSSQLKCLQCGWKWYSPRQYVSKLPDHVERVQSGLTDQDILDRLLDKTLRVCLETSVVTSTSSGVTKQLKIITRRSKGSTYRFVTIWRRGKKKKISLHRLVWMQKNLQLVPQGYDVDHVNGKNGQYPDRIENLQLLPMRDNRARNHFKDDDSF